MERKGKADYGMGELKIINTVVGMVMTNCYIAYDDDTREAFLVDPGDNARQIERIVQEQKLTVKAILLTHGHFDHIMAVPELKAAYAVPVYALEKEQQMLEDPGLNLSASWSGRSVSFTADRILRDGETFSVAGFSLRAIGTPGHTAGGVSYYMEAEKVLFSGDTLFCGSYGRTDLPTASEGDIARSINEKLLVLPEDVRVLPGHERETTIGFERKHNPLSRGWK